MDKSKKKTRLSELALKIENNQPLTEKEEAYRSIFEGFSMNIGELANYHKELYSNIGKTIQSFIELPKNLAYISKIASPPAKFTNQPFGMTANKLAANVAKGFNQNHHTAPLKGIQESSIAIAGFFSGLKKNMYELGMRYNALSPGSTPESYQLDWDILRAGMVKECDRTYKSKLKEVRDVVKQDSGIDIDEALFINWLKNPIEKWDEWYYVEMTDEEFYQFVWRYQDGIKEKIEAAKYVIDTSKRFNENRPKDNLKRVTHVLAAIPRQYDRYLYWMKEVATHVTTQADAVKYWELPPDEITVKIDFNRMGWMPIRIDRDYFGSASLDTDIIDHYVGEDLFAFFPHFVEPKGLELKIEKIIKFRLGDWQNSIIDPILQECKKWEEKSIPENEMSTSMGSSYRTRRLYVEFYKPYLENLIVKYETRSNGLEAKKLNPDTLTDIGITYTFENYLTDEGKQIFSQISHRYKDAKPAKLIPFLLAMADLGLITISPGSFSNQTHLHSHLKLTFGDIGTRQALNRSITLHTEADLAKRQKIDKVKVLLKTIVLKIREL